MRKEFEAMWVEHKNYVRRVLIGLSRDFDLADDLVQEVYLRASAGFDSYRGGDARAWLTTIARNTHHQHFRRKYLHSEVSYGETTEPVSGNAVGSDEDVLLIDLKKAISNLDSTLRTVLIMKHYGGFTYKEIAEKLDCPVGTVKWRVSEAIDRLRCSLEIPQREAVTMKCTDLTGAVLLDCIEGKLSARQQQAVSRHIEQCPACADRIKETSQILKALDLIEADFTTTCMIEIDTEGYTTGHIWLTMPNKTDNTMESLTLKQNGVEYMTIQGEEVHLEPLPDEPVVDERFFVDAGMTSYKTHLPQPVLPGEKIRMHTVVKHPPGPETARRLDNNRWRFGPGKLTLTEELLYVAAIRIPDGACLVSSYPEPTEVRSDTHTTVVWRGTAPPNEQFEFSVDYMLNTD